MPDPEQSPVRAPEVTAGLMSARGVLLAITLALSGCAPRGGASTTVPVVASFYPLYEFARRVGGARVAVRNLVPPGAESHDYEPTPQDVVALRGAKLLVYNGAGFEPWLEKLLPEVPPSVGVVRATDGLPMVAGQGHEGEEGALDPHVWLDPVFAQGQVERIRQGLVAVDPAGRASYEANARALVDELRALDREFAAALRACRQQVFITSHAAFGYLARRYGLRQLAISGLSPDIEPSPARLREVVRAARRVGARVIYYETLVSPRVAGVIAREVGAATRALNPLEGLTVEEQRAGKTYFTVMHDNLTTLAAGLECSDGPPGR